MLNINGMGTKRLVSKVLRQSARGQNCTLRLDGCNYDPSTTVLAHISLKGRSGMGIKPSDCESCFACSNCHDVIDGRAKGEYDDNDLLRAHFETLELWRTMGLVRFKGD